MSSEFLLGFVFTALRKYYFIAVPVTLIVILTRPSLVAAYIHALLFGLVWPWFYLAIAFLLYRSRVKRKPVEDWSLLSERQRGRKAAEIGTRW